MWFSPTIHPGKVFLRGVKVFTLNMDDDFLIMTFEPLSSSVSFINAVEVISVPSMTVESTKHFN